MRHKDTPRLVWIYALCINQNENEVKTKHVRNMGEIYASSTRVVVYLGGADDARIILFENVFDDSYFWTKVSPYEFSWPTKILQAVKEFLKRLWFSRVWILQEVFHGACCAEKWSPGTM